MKISHITLLLLAALSLSSAAYANDTAATVNGKPIKQSLRSEEHTSELQSH